MLVYVFSAYFLITNLNKDSLPYKNKWLEHKVRKNLEICIFENIGLESNMGLELLYLLPCCWAAPVVRGGDVRRPNWSFVLLSRSFFCCVLFF